MRFATGLLLAAVLAGLAVAWVLREPSADLSLPEETEEAGREAKSGKGLAEHAGPEGGEAPRSSKPDHEDSFWSAALAIETEEKAARVASILRATSARASTDVLSRGARQGKTRLVRAEAIFALVRRDTPGADAELLRVFKDAPGDFEKRTVLAGLGAQGNPRHLALLDALRDEAGDGQVEEYRRSRSRILGQGN